jgi:uncharacterized C2H2 Zn-finger protein
MTTIEMNNDAIFTKDPQTNLYTCSTCSYYTPLKNSYIKHLKTDKHKINTSPLECGQCNKLFYTKISYNNHVKSCIIQDSNQPENMSENEGDGDIPINEHDNDDDNDNDNDNDDGEEPDEELSLLLTKFGNQYDKLMIKYIIMFFLHIKENMLSFNLLLIFVLFMWNH